MSVTDIFASTASDARWGTFAIESDAMRPTIPRGSVVVVDLFEDRWVADHLYMVSINGNPCLRRLQHLSGGRMQVMTDAEPRIMETLTKEEAQSLLVIGRVRAVFREV